jgi:pathogenesis-related protein 1
MERINRDLTSRLALADRAIGQEIEMTSSFRACLATLMTCCFGLMAAASCSGSPGGGYAIAGAAGAGGGAAVGGGAGTGFGGSDGGVSCTVHSSDPSAVVRALIVEGGTLVEAAAPASIGSHPSVTNTGCSQITVDRGEPFIVPFAFTDTNTPVGGCLVTVAGATNHIEIDAAHCQGGLALAGKLPLRVTVPEQVCPGTFTLKYAAKADAPAISSYLPTVVTVSSAVARDAPPQTCKPPEPAPFTGITGAHNHYRGLATNGQLGNAPLIWDEALNPAAQHIADVFAATAKLPPEYPGYGANLIGFGEPQAEITPFDAVWAFVYPGNGCFTKHMPYPQSCSSCADSDLGPCMQYSQVVWAASSRLGCAVAPYANAAFGGKGQVWVCVYDPPGNQDGQIAF